MISTTDAAGYYTQADYDYRFLMPYRIKDINDNISYVDFDAFGRVSSSRIWGTEEGQPAGFPPPDVVPFIPPDSIDAALTMPSPQPVAQFYFYAPEAWMKPAPKEIISIVANSSYDYKQVIDEKGNINVISYQRWLRNSNIQLDKTLLTNDTERQPPYILTVTTDRYYPDVQQQQRQQINFIDGAGRSLQTALRVPAGDAYVVTKTGNLAKNKRGTAKQVPTSTRWAVTGRVEYDNKGLIVRQYQPFFSNSWHYIIDDSGRDSYYADTLYYDPLGREIRTVTAKGYERRQQYYPWFTVSEDENDTATNLTN